jgi:hypothetical protein
VTIDSNSVSFDVELDWRSRLALRDISGGGASPLRLAMACSSNASISFAM